MYKNKKITALLFFAVLAVVLVVFISGCSEKNSSPDNIKNSPPQIPANNSNSVNAQLPDSASNQTKEAEKNESRANSSAGAGTDNPKTGGVNLKENTTTETTGTTETTEPPKVSGIFIAKTSDVPEGSFRYFDYNGKKAILLNLNGEYKTYFNSCTHKGCQTEFKESVLLCPCHGSKFNPLTGEVMKGPASSPLGKIEVFIEDGSIYAK